MPRHIFDAFALLPVATQASLLGCEESVISALADVTELPDFVSHSRGSLREIRETLYPTGAEEFAAQAVSDAVGDA